VKTVYFDSTFGHPWVTTLVNLFLMRKESQPFLKHIFQISQEGEEDNQWTQKLDEGDCIIITGDQGRDKPRLPQICKDKHVTHIILTRNVHNSSKFERARAIIALWPQILQTFSSPPGSRYQIQQNSKKNDYVLVLKDYNDS
jgi:hypothetical protein